MTEYPDPPVSVLVSLFGAASASAVLLREFPAAVVMLSTVVLLLYLERNHMGESDD